MKLFSRAVLLLITATALIGIDAIADDGRLKKAENAFNQGDYSNAVHNADLAILSDTRNAPAYFIRAKALFKQKKFDKACTDFDTTLRINPQFSNSDVFQDRAICRLHDNKRPAAIADLRQAISMYASPYRCKLLAELYSQENDFTKAVIYYSKAIALDPTLTWGYKGRGRAYMQLGQFEKAIHDFSAFIKLSPKDPFGYTARGQAYSKTGKESLSKQDQKTAQLLQKQFDF